jgi:hypothetical protein
MIADGDLKGGQPVDWIVAGWFTPDYRPLAETFAANLREHGAPFHLWAKPKGEGWSTRRKPSVVRETLDTYPGATAILMDCDCIVRGDISPVANIAGDVGIVVLARNVRKGRRKLQHWLAVETSSRVFVARPTEGARAFLRRWSDQIASSAFDHDEHSQAWAFLASPDVAFSYIPAEFSGREIGQLPGAIIEHSSAHSRQKAQERSPVMEALRSIERRWLRTGRTAKEKATLPVMMKAT